MPRFPIRPSALGCVAYRTPHPSCVPLRLRSMNSTASPHDPCAPPSMPVSDEEMPRIAEEDRETAFAQYHRERFRDRLKEKIGWETTGTYSRIIPAMFEHKQFNYLGDTLQMQCLFAFCAMRAHMEDVAPESLEGSLEHVTNSGTRSSAMSTHRPGSLPSSGKLGFTRSRRTHKRFIALQ